MTEVQHLISEQRALRWHQFQTSKANSIEYSAKISSVLRSFLREDDHVVEIREADATNQSLQYSGYQPLVCGRRIAEAERHLLHLENTHVRDKSSFLDARRLHGNLIIRHREVETTEDCDASDASRASSSRGSEK